MQKKLFFSVLILGNVFAPFGELAKGQGNIVVNGSFENGGGGFTGWTLRNNPTDHYGLGTSGQFVTNVPDGSYYAAWYGPGNLSGSISQNLSTVPGAYYLLSFSAVCFEGTNLAGVSAGSLSTSLNFTSTVPVNGFYQINTNLGHYNSQWQEFSFNFQASATTTTLTLDYFVQTVNYGNIYWGDGGIDNISVTQVPEPSTLALAGVGLILGLAGHRLFRCNSREPL